MRKRERYERYGVAEYWIVDPEQRSTLILTLVDGRHEPLTGVEPGRVRSRVLPGLVVPAAAVFDKMLADLLGPEQLSAADAYRDRLCSERRTLPGGSSHEHGPGSVTHRR